MIVNGYEKNTLQEKFEKRIKNLHAQNNSIASYAVLLNLGGIQAFHLTKPHIYVGRIFLCVYHCRLGSALLVH